MQIACQFFGHAGSKWISSHPGRKYRDRLIRCSHTVLLASVLIGSSPTWLARNFLFFPLCLLLFLDAEEVQASSFVKKSL